MRIFHIVDRDAWATAQEDGTYAPSSLDTEGFVHFSFAHQVRRVHQAIYADVPNLFVLEVDPAQVGSDIRVEDSYDAGEEFPHIYGEIPARSAMGTYELDDALFTGGHATTDR